MRRHLALPLLAFALTLALQALHPEEAHAIGFLLPTDTSLQPLRIDHHRVSVDVRERVAETRVEQTFFNTTDRRLEGTYVFPVPEGATVSGFTMWVNGQRMEGELLDASTARSIYESIVARMQDPGLVEHMGGNLFRARVFPIEPHSEQRIEIRFAQTLDYEGSLVHYRYPLRTQGPATSTLADYTVSLDIVSRTAIRAVYSPTHNIAVSRENDHHVIASYEGTRATLDQDFDLFYSVDDAEVGLSLLTHRARGEDGYFLAMVAPRTELTDRELASKEVLFVFDTSGSMAGEKIDRAKAALDYMLARLRPQDRFQVIRFSTDVELLFDDGTSHEASPGNIARARNFAAHFVPAGGTAIEPALREAFRTRNTATLDARMVVFLTDGMPTVGVTDPASIVRLVQSNGNGARLFAFGVGDDVNTTFLDSLAASAGGTGAYFRDGGEMERRLASFYDRIAYPAVTNVRLTFHGDVNQQTGPGSSAYDIYPREIHALYRGEQILVVGRYRNEGPARVVLEGRVGNEASDRTFAFNVSFPTFEPRNEFVPRVWAVRKVGGLLDEIRLHGERAELRQEVISVARRFGLVTPYTSYLVAPDVQVTQPQFVERRRPDLDMHFSVDAQLRVPAPSPPRDREESRFEGFETTVTQPSTSSSHSGSGSAPAGQSAPSGATGERGRRISEEVHEMASAERADGATSQGVRFALGRAFTWQSGAYVDANHHEGMRELRIRPMSRAYFALLTLRPELRAAFALGSNVVIVLDRDRAIVIDPQSPDTDEESARAFVR